MLKQPLFKEFAIISAVVATLHTIATYLDWYDSVHELDSLLHFLAGVMVASFFIWFYFYSGFFRPTNFNKSEYFLIALLGTLLVGVSWEIFELIMGITGVTRVQYAFDTSLDVTMDTLGALVTCLYAIYAKKYAHK